MDRFFHFHETIIGGSMVRRLKIIFSKFRPMFDVIGRETTFPHRLRRFLVFIAVVVGILLIFQILRNAYLIWGPGWEWQNWPEAKSIGGKTLWEWFELLVVPLMLAVVALFFNWQERRVELRIAENRNQDAILLNYLDKMSELVLEHGLMEVKQARAAVLQQYPHLTESELEKVLSDSQSSVRDMAQARTVTVLRQLNRDRKDTVLQFLRDTDLASFVLAGSSLAGIDFRFAKLERLNLSEADLSDAKLQYADLRDANLSKAEICRSNLSNAMLSGANLSEARLYHSTLFSAALEHANLTNAEMASVNFIGVELENTDIFGRIVDPDKGYSELLQAASLDGSTMPDGKLYIERLYGPTRRSPRAPAASR